MPVAALAVTVANTDALAIASAVVVSVAAAAVAAAAVAAAAVAVGRPVGCLTFPRCPAGGVGPS
jgi:hypothetical protein